MPEAYLKIKQQFIEHGYPEKEAASHAARIFISAVKSKKARSKRAKELRHGG